MEIKTLQIFKSLLVGLALLALLGRADAQQSPPASGMGVDMIRVVAIDNLGAEMDGLQGYTLRMFKLTLGPGGATTLHSHKDIPELAYVVQGNITEHKNGVSKEYGPGEAFTATKETTHWFENKGSSPAAFIGAIVVRQR